ATARISPGSRGARAGGQRAGLGAQAGVAEEPAAATRRTRSNAAEAPANLGACSHCCASGLSDEDGGPLDAVLLPQLLPVLTCLHRLHPAWRLVPDHQCRDQYHFSSFELGGDFEFMDVASMCTAIAISLLMILICAVATYGGYRQHVAWIIPFSCYQVFDFSLNTLVAVIVLVYPDSIQEYIRQLPPDFLYEDDSMSGYLISCVWNCYRFISGRNSSDVLASVTSNDTTVLCTPVRRCHCEWHRQGAATTLCVCLSLE
ncbi:hypothetical protein EI555_016539, partial [Monodon monoceros]